jgi:hypothetical protein
MPEVIKAAACGSLIKKPRLIKHTIYNLPSKKFLLEINSIHYFPREGTGIQKFKRGKWSTSDESPPKKKKTDTDSGTAHLHLY